MNNSGNLIVNNSASSNSIKNKEIDGSGDFIYF
jgi:hypothetical protein